MTLLECIDVTKTYGGLTAVNNLSFSVNLGEVLAIVGPNGAGKTTLFDTISGHSPASSGSIVFDGNAIEDASPHEICRQGLVRTFQTTTAFVTQNVLTNVLVAAVFGRSDRATWLRFDQPAVDAATKALEFVGLLDRQHETAGTLPILERKRLMLATALATRPKLLLLDEPVGGLNAAERDQFVELVSQVAASGITVLMIEHVMKAVHALADRMIVLHHGEKLAEGPPKEVLRDKRVVEVYLGRSATTITREEQAL